MIESELCYVKTTLDGPILGRDSEKVKAGLLFLLDMKNFMNTMDFPGVLEVNKEDWKWLDTGLDHALARLSKEARSGMERLESAMEAMQECSTSLQFPSSINELVGDRALVEIASSAENRQVLADEESIQCDLVDRFDKSLIKFLVDIATLVQGRANDLHQNGLNGDEKIETTKKETNHLLETVALASKACSIYKELNSRVLSDTELGLAGAKARL